MTRLGLVSSLVGGLLVATRLPGIVWPGKFRAHALGFPRSLLWGRVLMGLVAGIAGVVVFGAASDMLRDIVRERGEGGLWSFVPALVAIGIPIAYWLVIQYGTQFLAMRATAALMLLIAKQLVDAADGSELPSRLFVTVLAYFWVVVAIWMTVAPHHFRDLIGYVMANDQRCRAVCGIGTGLGIALLALGMFVY